MVPPNLFQEKNLFTVFNHLDLPVSSLCLEGCIFYFNIVLNQLSIAGVYQAS